MSSSANSFSPATEISPAEKEKIVRRVSVVGIGGNVVLSAFKLFAGIFGHSTAMISDAVHSLSDVFATFIAMIGVRLSERGADKEHPYGHERFECVASIILSIVLLATGLLIGYTGLKTILTPGASQNIEIPGVISLVAAIVSIVVKEAMFRYTMVNAKKIQSSAFAADAWHHRSDALSSIGALIGIGGALLGWPILDPIASIVICLFILKVAIDIFRDAMEKMVDKACPEEYEQQLRECIMEQEKVLGIDLLRTRIFGEKVYVEAEILLDGKMTLNESHAVAEDVHAHIEKSFSNVKHIIIHVNPADKK